MSIKPAHGTPPPPDETGIEARVVGRRGPAIFVETDAGERISCLGRGPGKSAVVGDRVMVSLDAHTELSEALVESVLPRSSELKRIDANKRKPQVLAANVEQILVVSAAFPEMREGLVDRYVVAAHAQGVRPQLVFNKIDLIEDEETRSQIRNRLQVYEDLGYTIHYVSAQTTEGLSGLRDSLRDRLSILVGHSGVGKTSLLNALFPHLEEDVRELSEASGRGRHTTTSSSLYPLDEGGAIIDSPGIRSFGLWGIARDDLRDHYPEFAARSAQCRFGDCQHLSEPACAVRAALEAGDIAKVRYENYCRIRASLDEDDKRR